MLVFFMWKKKSNRFFSSFIFFFFFLYLIRILQTLCRKLKLPESFEFRHLARLTPGYVGADLMALCREAAMCTVNRVLITSEEQRRKHTHSGGNTAEGSMGIGTDILVEEGTKQPELPPKVCVP